MSRFISVIVHHKLLIIYPQLISRIGHPKPADALMIEQFLVKIFCWLFWCYIVKMGSVAHSK